MALSSEQVVGFNSIVRKRAQLTKRSLYEKLRSYGLHDYIRANGKKSLMKSLAVGFGKKDGQIEVVKYKFALHGVFFDRGVGRGQKRNQTGKRVAKPWMFIIDEDMEKLAADIADQYGNEALESIRKIS